MEFLIFEVVFGLIFMGFWWGEYKEHDGSLKIDFWKLEYKEHDGSLSFDGGVFWSEISKDDLESLARFLNKPRVDLSSLGDFELNGMVENIG